MLQHLDLRSLVSFLIYVKQKLQFPSQNIGTGAVFIPEIRYDLGVIQELVISAITREDINLSIPVLKLLKRSNSFELTLKKFFCHDSC